MDGYTRYINAYVRDIVYPMDNLPVVNMQPSEPVPPQQSLNANQSKIKSSPIVIIVGLVILIVAIAGTYFWQHKEVDNLNTEVASLNHQVGQLKARSSKQSSATNPTPPSTASNPYSGWASYTTKNEKLSFKYPPSFTLTDDSTVANNDDVYLKASNNFEIYIHVGGGVQDVCPYGGCNIVQSDRVTFNNQPAFLDIWSSETTPGAPIDKAYLSQSSTNYSDYFNAKNVSGVIFIGLGYNTDPVGSSQTNYVPVSLSNLLNDPNYADAKLVIQSMHY